MNKKIIMVTGCQRSGTSALFHSFKTDPLINGFMEVKDSKIYQNFKLRSEKKIRKILVNNKKSSILLKPISENRSWIDIFKEYKNYNLNVVCIYRNPINVFYSWNKYHEKLDNIKDWIKIDRFIEIWNQKYKKILEAFNEYRSKIIVVKYEDIISDRNVFDRLCKLLKIKGNYIFRKDKNKGIKNLSKKEKEAIDKGTCNMLTKLDKLRNFKINNN